MRVLRYWRVGLGAAALAGALGAGVAFAQPVPTFPECTKKATPQDNELAKNAHKLATRYYDQADYDKAIQYWNEAYNFDCSVNDLLINIANAYEKKGDKAATVATLEAYLKRTGKNEVIEAKVKNIKAAMAAPAPTPSVTASTAPTATAVPTAAPSTVPTAPTPEGPRPYGNTPWFVVGGGGALAIIGAILLPVGLGKVRDAENKCPTHANCSNDVADEGNAGQAMTKAGGSLLGIGLAAAAGGLVWQFALNKPGPAGAAPKKAGKGPRDVWVMPATAGRGQSGVVLGGSF